MTKKEIRRLSAELLRLEAELRLVERMDAAFNPIHYDPSYYQAGKQHNKHKIIRLKSQITVLKELLTSKNPEPTQRDLFDLGQNYVIPD